jgi:hypothetical protein
LRGAVFQQESWGLSVEVGQVCALRHGPLHAMPAAVIALCVGLLVIVVASSSDARRVFSARSPLLRALVPSWRFFERPDAVPELLLRHCPQAAAPGPWLPAIHIPVRAWYNVLWNPLGNLALAKYSLLDRLIADLADAGEVTIERAEQLVSFRLVQRVCEEALLPTKDGAAPPYQFKVVLIAGEAAAEELLLSDVYQPARSSKE